MKRIGDVLQAGEFEALRRGIEEAKARRDAARRRLATEGLQAAKEFDAELPPDQAAQHTAQTLVEAALGKKPEE
jgi:hypothetical protein